MNFLKDLQQRSGNACELCKNTEGLAPYNLPPSTSETIENTVLLCSVCRNQIENPETMDINHWRCVNDSMWSEHKPVQILVWRLLQKLRNEGWPQDLLDMMYLDEETLAYAKAGVTENNSMKHIDSNGNILSQGDTVVLIKDLDVKGSSITAKRGTAVRNIRLDHENDQYIEGKVDGQQLVILTKFVKRV